MTNATTTAGAGGGPAALDVATVSHSYGHKKALDAVSFSIPAGRFTVLLGLNGAGKTTLFSLVSHLYDTRHGVIRIFGHDIRQAPGEALRRLGIVFQARTLDLDLSVGQNLSYHAALHGIGRREAQARIGALLAQVDMADRLHDKARNLSGGQMRRIEIVRALLHRPSLLLLDEATVGLDIRSRAEILETIRALVTETGISVLWATHLIDEVDDSDDVVILDRGKVLAAGAVASVVREAGEMDIARAFASLTRSVPVDARGSSISPLVGEMPGRAEGGRSRNDLVDEDAERLPLTSISYADISPTRGEIAATSRLPDYQASDRPALRAARPESSNHIAYSFDVPSAQTGEKR